MRIERLRADVDELTAQLEKQRAIIAELVDYVYDENRRGAGGERE